MTAYAEITVRNLRAPSEFRASLAETFQAAADSARERQTYSSFMSDAGIAALELTASLISTLPDADPRVLALHRASLLLQPPSNSGYGQRGYQPPAINGTPSKQSEFFSLVASEYLTTPEPDVILNELVAVAIDDISAHQASARAESQALVAAAQEETQAIPVLHEQIAGHQTQIRDLEAGVATISADLLREQGHVKELQESAVALEYAKARVLGLRDRIAQLEAQLEGKGETPAPRKPRNPRPTWERVEGEPNIYQRARGDGTHTYMHRFVKDTKQITDHHDTLEAAIEARNQREGAAA
jgi:hypothetical protein